MSAIVEKMRHWWSQQRQPALYQIACECGQVLRGQRQVRHQVARCPACGGQVFVLPRSPLPPVLDASADSSVMALSVRKSSAKRQPRRQLRALLAVVAVLVFLTCAALLWRNEQPASAPFIVDPSRARFHVEEGRKSLAAANFQLALEQLDLARGLTSTLGEALTGQEKRALLRLHSQAALLADLSKESVSEILRDAAGHHEREWQALFNRHHKGKGILFDVEIRRDAAGQCQVSYQVHAGNENARVDVDNLKVLHELPLEKPTRVLFGARLQEVRREPSGQWVVSFEPDSGVLLTDLKGAILGGLLPPDPSLLVVVERQKAWINERP